MASVDRLETEHIAQKRADLFGVWRIEDGMETGDHAENLPRRHGGTENILELSK